MIRTVCCYDIACLMDYRRWTLERSAAEVVMKKIPALGGDGGVVAVDAKGNITMPFNTQGMYRGWVDADGSGATAIYHDDDVAVSLRR